MSMIRKSAFLAFCAGLAMTQVAVPALAQTSGTVDYAVSGVAPAPSMSAQTLIYVSDSATFRLSDGPGLHGKYRWFDGSVHEDDFTYEGSIQGILNNDAENGLDTGFAFRKDNFWLFLSRQPYTYQGRPNLYRVYYSFNGRTFRRYLTNSGTSTLIEGSEAGCLRDVQYFPHDSLVGNERCDRGQWVPRSSGSDCRWRNGQMFPNGYQGNDYACKDGWWVPRRGGLTQCVWLNGDVFPSGFRGNSYECLNGEWQPVGSNGPGRRSEDARQTMDDGADGFERELGEFSDEFSRIGDVNTDVISPNMEVDIDSGTMTVTMPVRPKTQAELSRQRQAKAPRSESSRDTNNWDFHWQNGFGFGSDDAQANMRGSLMANSDFTLRGHIGVETLIFDNKTDIVAADAYGNRPDRQSFHGRVTYTIMNNTTDIVNKRMSIQQTSAADGEYGGKILGRQSFVKGKHVFQICGIPVTVTGEVVGEVGYRGGRIYVAAFQDSSFLEGNASITPYANVAGVFSATVGVQDYSSGGVKGRLDFADVALEGSLNLYPSRSRSGGLCGTASYKKFDVLSGSVTAFATVREPFMATVHTFVRGFCSLFKCGGWVEKVQQVTKWYEAKEEKQIFAWSGKNIASGSEWMSSCPR